MHPGSGRALEAALRGAQAVVCTGRLGGLPNLAQRRSVEHLVVLCSSATGHLCMVSLCMATHPLSHELLVVGGCACMHAGMRALWALSARSYHLLCGVAGGNGLSLVALLDAEAAAQRDPRRKAAVQTCGVPHTIVRVGRITDAPGGMQQLRVSQIRDAQPCMRSYLFAEMQHM
jgi:hypothetical protein